jgi:hypothetical protein
MDDHWKVVDQEVEQAFDNGEVLRADRATLDRWLASLTGRTYECERDQKPMERRFGSFAASHSRETRRRV